MRILIASVTNKGSEYIAPHIASIRALELPPRTEVSLAYISDGAPPESCALLNEAGASIADALPKPADAGYAVTEETHHWNLSTFGWLAREKQRLLDHAREARFDAIFLVDSDLVLGPETLSSLVSASKDIVSAVFWTRWQPGAPPLPQTWLTHPYDFKGRSGARHLEPHEFLGALAERRLVEVGGLGACTLIRTAILDRVGFFPLVEGLPMEGMWQGEDRHFCVHAARAHVSLWADAWPDIVHLYRPSDVEALGGVKWPTRVTHVSWGDDVSAILEPLEEPELAKLGFKYHLRGRVGQLRILPEIEDALLSTPVGEDRIIKVRFPEWWSLAQIRGATKTLRLQVLDAKSRF